MTKILCVAGKNDIAVNVLDYARHHCKGCELLAVLNRNESYRDSWQKSAGLYCRRNDIPTVTLEDIYPLQDMVFISAEFDRIITPSKFASGNLFNIHFSLLPKYKGCNTSIMPILHGETESGVTLHRIRRGIDTGEIIAQKKFAVEYDCTGLDLYRKYIDAGSRLAIEYIDRLMRNDFTETPQDYVNSEYFSRSEIDYTSLQLDTGKTAWQIHNQIRAFAFRPYQLLKFRNCGLVGSTITGRVSSQRPGTVLEETETYFLMASVDYDIYIYKDVLNEILASLHNNDNERAKSLCTFSRIIYDTDINGTSPMSLAVSQNNSEMIRFFTEKTLDAIELGRYNQSTEHRAQSTEHRHNLSLHTDRKSYVFHKKTYLTRKTFSFTEELCISAS